MLNEAGEEVPASIFSKVTYKLHESFGDRAKQSWHPRPCARVSMKLIVV
jgi:transcription initiation factor IIF auxiliary subunit